METVKNGINWFEIPVADFSRAKKFYESIFDFEMPEMDFGTVKMGILPHDQEQGVGGAICSGDGYAPAGSRGPKIYLNGGQDLNTVLHRVNAAGGQIELPKTQISPEHGFMGFFSDTEGNLVGLHSMG